MVIKFDLSIYNTKCLCVNIHTKNAYNNYD